VNAEISEIIANLTSSYNPYGDGKSTSNSPIIALGESWAYYMGHTVADFTYGLNSSTSYEQQTTFSNNYPVDKASSHLNLLESFDPKKTTDPFHWIPQGLFYDLLDPANETGVPVLDQVSGYTNQQMFNAFQSNIVTLQDYRARLLQTTTNSTSVYVTNLFNQYNY